jgi:hypothetical protein
MVCIDLLLYIRLTYGISAFLLFEESPWRMRRINALGAGRVERWRKEALVAVRGRLTAVSVIISDGGPLSIKAKRRKWTGEG